MTLEELIDHLSRSTQHKFLYHFTDAENFPSIAANGLLSKRELDARGIAVVRPGGNDLSRTLDQTKGIYNDISLCLTREHPMKFTCTEDGRQPDSKYLAIKPEVLSLDGVRIAFGIANANATVLQPIETGIQMLDIEVLYSRTDWADPEVNERLRLAERVEVLVPTQIPRSMIAGVC